MTPRMRNIKLVLEYDGKSFFGFQRQPQHPTIQETLEKALSRLLDRKTQIAAASGRTDTGVHALQQVVNFKTQSTLDVRQIHKGLNALLPDSIAVKIVSEMPAGFNARFDARWKTYEYWIWNHPIRSPLAGQRMWHVPYSLDLVSMRAAVGLLRGRRDFRSFCAAHGSVETTVRTIRKFSLKVCGPVVILKVEADGFLYHMVRNLVGTLVDIGRGRLQVKDLRKIMAAKDRRRAGPTAPAQGLFLASVTY